MNSLKKIVHFIFTDEVIEKTILIILGALSTTLMVLGIATFLILILS